MAKGRPKSNDPKCHTVQSFLTKAEKEALDSLRQALSAQLGGRRVSSSEVIRACLKHAFSVAEAKGVEGFNAEQ